jgi:excisionase family DNA binding protein
MEIRLDVNPKELAKELSAQLIEQIKNFFKNDGPEILTLQGLSDYLKVTPNWIYKKVSLKEIPYFKSGKHLRFLKREIDNWIASESVSPIPKKKMS